MENKTIKNALSLQNITRRLMAVLLILAMLSFVGCKDKDKDKGKDKEKVTSSQVTSSNHTDSSDLDDEDDDSKTDKSPTSNATGSGKVDPAKGELSVNAVVETTLPRDDADEIIPTGNCAILSNPLVGHYEAEADAARKRILNTKNTAELYKITGTTYYVSPNGNDDNKGTSPDKPLRTIDAAKNLKLKKGDAVLFERGSVFRLASAFTTTEGAIYGSYGEGAKPKIYASTINYATAEWQPYHRKNVWKLDFVGGEACGLFIDHGKICGMMKTGTRALQNNGDFYTDKENGLLYMYCDKGNPSNAYDDIEVSQRMDIFKVPGHTGNVVIDNLCMKYAGVLAVEATFNNFDITVTNCEIGYIGGATSGSVRLGNAVQVWQGGQGFYVNNNWIYQTWDTAISWQGFGQGTPEKPISTYSNIVHNDNLLEYNNADFEFWDDNEILDGFEMRNNICRFTSQGWGTRLLDGGYRGIEGVFGNCKTSDMDIRQKIIVENTIIDCPGREIINWYIYGTDRNEDKGAQMWDLLDVSGTKVFVNKEYRGFNRSLRGCRRVESDPSLTDYSNHKTLEDSIKRFDRDATVISVGYPDSNG